jgi:hypothetical protein
MLPDDQEVRLRCYRNALRNWNFRGYIRFKQRVERWLQVELPGLQLLEIARELYQFVEDGGEIDEQVEKRPLECAEDDAQEFRYDLRVMIGRRRVYFETVLLCEDADDPDEPMIVVVNVHDV